MEYTLEEKYELIKKEILKSTSTNPIEIVKSVMHQSFINIHGPEHHFLDGASFLVAYNNATNGSLNIEEAINELAERSCKMPGAMCGMWGVCGAVASLGSALSIIHKVGPLTSNEHYKNDMEYTSRVLSKLSKIGGPRCCKRNAFIAINTAIDFVREKYGINLTKNNKTTCEFSPLNKQCLQEKCPFNR